MGETRVNLRHLLEDIRDSYPIPQEEIIITELLANSIDSHANNIKFTTDIHNNKLTIIDNGKGMDRKTLHEYHDIASTTKTRGMGIGFAGVGAKLSLLISEKVITETTTDTFQGATVWKLESNQKAPWKHLEPSGLVENKTGTAVSIFLKGPLKLKDSPLLNPKFIGDIIKKHFYTILEPSFQKILRNFYGIDFNFYVNEQKIELSNLDNFNISEAFKIHIGKREKPAGVGFLRKYCEELPEEKRGIAVSTCGKVIKQGWEWLGIMPKNPSYITGIVEIPGLSTILTTNKADFLRDTSSLQKYYKYRKAILEAIEPILNKFSELSEPIKKKEKRLNSFEKEIGLVLDNIMEEFPELDPLIGKKGRSKIASGFISNTGEAGFKNAGIDIDAAIAGIEKEADGTFAGDVLQNDGNGGDEGINGDKNNGDNSDKIDNKIENGDAYLNNPDIAAEAGIYGKQHKINRKPSGLMIDFYENNDSGEPGKLGENTVWINKAHPAFKKAERNGNENYHIAISIALVLSGYLNESKSTKEFINKFLSAWGKDGSLFL